MFVCEEQKLDGLITLDLRLRRLFEQSKKRLKTPIKVLLPSEVCNAHAIGPVGAEWFAEGEKDVWSKNIVQLFARNASRRDRLAYKGYRLLIFLRDKCGAKNKFVIPGY